MRGRRAIAILTLLLTVAGSGMTAQASSEDCRTGSVDWRGGTPFMVDDDPSLTNGIYWGINGTFLWYYIGPEAPENPETDALSVEVTEGVTRLSVCADGTVTLSSSALELANRSHNDCQEDESCWDCKTMGNKKCGEETTTTWVDITTTTVTSTPTTEQPSTTTVPTVESSSTTTSIPETATTSTQPSSTVTYSGPTTTDPANSTTVPSDPSTLPFTGARETGLLIAGGAILVGLGTLMILLWEKARRNDE